MYKGIEWLKAEVWKQDTVMDKGYIYTDDLMSIINDVDEPEVLSQEWIDEHAKAVAYDGMPDQTEIVYIDELENLIIPKQELPVIPYYVAEYVELAKSDVTLMRVLEIANRRDELPKWEKEYDWISANDETFARAWLDGYEVEEEPSYYALIKGHELIAGEDACKYWKCDMRNGRIFLSNRYSHCGKYLAEMSKEDWNELGINDSNADFVRVEQNN